MTGPHPDGCACGLHNPSPQRNVRIGIGLELHYAAVGVSDDPRRTQQREWARRNRTRINAAARARRAAKKGANDAR